ncbi:MAG: Mur ligase family protein, partial [Pseudomonadota bacterium]
TNARLGGGEWVVVEADESDGTFVKLPADVAVVTNIDAEHLDHYGSFDSVREAFLQFVENVPFYGFAVMCIDHPEVQSLIGRIEDRRVVTYGQSPQADVRTVDIRVDGPSSRFEIELRERGSDQIKRIADLTLPMPGLHNLLNATAAIAVAHNLGLSAEQIRSGLARFSGVKRRFTHTGDWKGVAIYDDYGHHPVEISAVLKAAREATSGNVIAVVQPHRYTRLRDLFEQFAACFNDADTVLVAPVYPAGEAPIEGASHLDLIDAVRAHGHRSVGHVDGPDDLPEKIAARARSGDSVVCLGAGSITSWANALPDLLKATAA